MTTRRFIPLAVLFLLAFSFIPGKSVSGQEGSWTILGFTATYAVNQDASVEVVEDILVDFGSNRQHGIYREIPVEYQIEGDPRHHRLITLRNVRVDNGEGQPHKFSSSRNGVNQQFKIGDPDRTITGVQRYRISYTVTGAFNSFDTHDEFYWNVTGLEWDTTIEEASATLTAVAIQDAICFEGRSRSTTTCDSAILDGTTARYVATSSLSAFEGLTIVAAIPPDRIDVPPPQLKYIKTPEEVVRDFLGVKPLPIAGALIFGVVGVGAVVRNWWLSGRDRWSGDVHYLTGHDTPQNPKPLFARETVVPEYTPPEIGVRKKRALRPAEIGLLLDERADTLDVTATIIDLAVRGYLRIDQIEGEGWFGKDDYELFRLKESDEELLDYERRLHDELFDGAESVKLSGLKNKFYKDLEVVKNMLYTQGVSKNEFFSRNPQDVRGWYVGGGLLVAAAGVGLFVLLGVTEIGALLAVPVIVAGLLLVAFSSAMPRRTAKGREFHRRCLGFREYMVTAETDRQRFYEDVSIFDKYLPYAIVYGCTEKWAEAFEGIEGIDTSTRGWYSGTRPFTPVLFASTLNTFSSSVGNSIASTPSSSGSSGFSSGGGFSGGGFGGGGGGRW